MAAAAWGIDELRPELPDGSRGQIQSVCPRRIPEHLQPAVPLEASGRSAWFRRVQPAQHRRADQPGDSADDSQWSLHRRIRLPRDAWRSGGAAKGGADSGAVYFLTSINPVSL